MNNTRSLHFALTLCLAAFGCGSALPNDTAAEVSAAQLDQPNGGLSTTDEMPEFNDSNFAALPEMSAEAGTDTVLDESGSYTGDTVALAQRHVFRVMILWGHMPRPNDGAALAIPPAPLRPTDWSGTLSVDASRISVRRTLGLEAGDRIAPRTDASSVGFVSHTLPFVDGLALTVRTPSATPVLRFRSAGMNLELPLPDADGEVRYLSDGRNGVYYAAYEERPACGQGFVFGHWARVRPELGVFRGQVVDAVGAPRGSIRGIWGATRRGDHSFFGKHISNAGVFNGMLGGSYANGHFGGAWGTRDGQRGELHGRYFDGIERHDGRGVLLGRWREACPAR